MNPKVSIITVVHNGADTIADTIESVLAQQGVDVEHVIIDGRSTDGTVDVVHRYADLHPESIRWISEPDTGIYDAINKGIEMSTGSIIGILNADDFYHRTDAIAVATLALTSDPQLHGIYADVRIVSAANRDRTVRMYRSAHFRPWMFRLGMMPAHPGFFTYRTTFETYGLYRTDFSISADFEMLVRLMLINKLRIGYLPEVLLTMRAGGRSDSGFAAKMEINRQVLRALRLHGLFSCHPMLWLRYPIKLMQYLCF